MLPELVSFEDVKTVADRQYDPHRWLVNTELHQLFDEQLIQLTVREERVIRWRFGLDGEPPMTLQQIADEFQVSRERIRQIEKRALARLRRSPRSLKTRPFIEGWTLKQERELRKTEKIETRVRSDNTQLDQLIYEREQLCRKLTRMKLKSKRELREQQLKQRERRGYWLTVGG